MDDGLIYTGRRGTIEMSVCHSVLKTILLVEEAFKSACLLDDGSEKVIWSTLFTKEEEKTYYSRSSTYTVLLRIDKGITA
jgi:hypothetical protein